MLKEVRDLPKVTQPDLVTTEDILVSPGMSPSAPPAEKDQLAHFASWKTGELLRRGAIL